tara:strand:+ start:59 stop:454 length:396 start_codon:yes stop_codon:yes gene_type:complete
MNKMTKIKIPFAVFLALVSISGFLVIVFDAFSKIDVSLWAQGLIFIVIGTGLALLGGVFGLKQILEGGITEAETASILSIVVGAMSIFVGLVTLPINFLNNLDIPAFAGVRGIIAIFAIIFISVETFKMLR